MKQIPLLFLGDSPDLQNGLGRIGRDLSCLATSLPQFRIGYLGRGGNGSRQLPFAQYNFNELEQWGENQIERAWSDFAGNQKGIIFSIWDASRLLWFSRPEGMEDTPLRRFLTSGKFDRWGYFPIDSEGPGGKLTRLSAETIRGYQRPLAYGAYGAEVIQRSTGRAVDWIPHGIDLSAFQPRDKTAARMAMGVGKDDFVIGCLMSNQQRKDWGVAFATIHSLRAIYPNLKFWVHVDVMERSHAWSLLALIDDFGMGDIVRVTMSGSMNDEQLSYCYSACDLTILPSTGEGFGYSIVESMACGVPVIHGKYAGGVELIPAQAWLVEPHSWRLETIHNCVRPVYRPEDWMQHVMSVREAGAGYTSEYCRAAVEHLDWSRLWPSAWSKFFVEGAC